MTEPRTRPSGRSRQRQQQDDVAAVNDAAEDVAAKLVDAEGMREALPAPAAGRCPSANSRRAPRTGPVDGDEQVRRRITAPMRRLSGVSATPAGRGARRRGGRSTRHR